MSEAPGTRRRRLGERLRRFFSTPEELEAADLEERARGSGARPISESNVRDSVRLRGTITSMTAVAESGWLEAELSDGTGIVKLVWMGRRRIDCIMPGTHLLVTGRLARSGEELVIYNPDFEVVS